MCAVPDQLILTDHLPGPYHSQLNDPLWPKSLCLREVLVELLCLGCILGDQLLLILVLMILVVIYDLGDLALTLLN